MHDRQDVIEALKKFEYARRGRVPGWIDRYDELLPIAVAWLKGELTLRQTMIGFGFEPGSNGGGFYNWIAQILREAIDLGHVKIEYVESPVEAGAIPGVPEGDVPPGSPGP